MKKKLFWLLVLSLVLSIMNPSIFQQFKTENVMAATTVGIPKLISAKSVSTGITVTWEALEDVSGYRIFRKLPGKNWAGIKTISGAEKNNYTDETAVDGVTYIYTVRAYKRENGTAVWGSYDFAGVSVTMPPAAPKLISAKGSGINKIALRWNAVSGVNGYRIFRKEYGTSKWTALRTITSGTTVSYIDGTAKMGVRYYYTVRTYKRVDGKVVWGKYDAKGLLANSLVAAPQLVSATASADGSVVLKWKQSGTVNGYNIYRKVPNGKWVLIKKGNSTISYKDNACVPGQTYIYTVRAFVTTNGSSVSSSYNTVGLKVTTKVPAPPRAEVKWVGVSDAGAHVQITWKAQKSVDGYYIYRRENINGTWQKWSLIGKRNGVSSNTFIDKKAVWNAKYRYTVRSFKQINGKNVLSAYDSVGVEFDVKIPSTKKVSLVENGINDVTITWEVVEGAAGYRVYRKDASSNAWKLVKALSGQNVTTCKDISVEENVTYTYAVRAFVKYNNQYILGLYDGNSYKITTKVYYPEEPDVLSVTPKDSTHLVVKWNPEKYATGYNIYRKKTGDVKWVKCSTIKKGSTAFNNASFTDSGLEEEQTYCYTVSSLKSMEGINFESSYNSVGVQGTTLRGVLGLSETNLIMTVDETVTIKFKGTSKPAQWSSSDPTVATVTNGTIKALKEGNVEIEAEFEGEKYVCKLTVEQPVISSSNVEMTIGGSKNLGVTGTSQKVTWTYNSRYVSLETIGEKAVKVTPIKAGTFTVTAVIEMNDRQICLDCQFVVKGSIYLGLTDVTVNIGEKEYVSISSDYFNLYADSIHDELVSWSLEPVSQDEYVLVITGKKVGEATITVYSRDPDTQSYITVTVEEGNSVESNNQKLKDFIWENGQTIDSTFKSVAYYGEYEGAIYCWAIGYESTSDFFSYSMSVVPADENADSDQLVVGIGSNVAQTNRVFASASWLYESQGMGCELEATLFADTYNNQTVAFNVAESVGMTTAQLTEMKEIANDALKIAFEGWETLILKDKVGITFKDLGFTAYTAP